MWLADTMTASHRRIAFIANLRRIPRLPALAILAGLPVAVAIWAIASPPVIFSSEMTWDLLFNVVGAWHLASGQVPHVDYHEPVGALTFLLTLLGFDLVGVSPRAVAAGVAVAGLAIFACAVVVAVRRLPLLPAVVFVLFVTLIVLRPANVGDFPDAYSFAMAYNRYGWSAVSVIALALFVPPGDRSSMDWADLAIVALLTAAVFYLKITYFAVAAAAILLAIVISPHIGQRRIAWCLVALGAGALAAAPFNAAYLGDIHAAADAGIVRDDLGFWFNDFAENAAQYAPYFAALAATLWFCARGTVPIRVPLATGFMLGAGLALLSQNSQAHGVPLAVVIAFLIQREIEGRLPVAPASAAMIATLLLVFPAASIVSSVTSVAGYKIRTTAGYMQIADSTALRGLAVPMEPPGVISAFASDRGGYRLLNRARAVRPRYELSPYEYVETLKEAADLLASNGLATGRIALLDQVNPVPFMLGLEPPRGGNLWSGAGAPTIATEAYLGGVDHVLIPKFSTNIGWTDTAIAVYGSTLERDFTRRIEGRSWILLSRSPTSSR